MLKKRAPHTFSNQAIEICNLLRFKYKLPLRGATGLVTSVFEMLKIDLSVPDYSTLCRRLKELKNAIDYTKLINCKENVHVVVDSTGLKVFGDGEWKVRQHGYSKRRTWRKLHIGVDEKSGAILAACLSTNDVSDSQAFPKLVEELSSNTNITQITGDGAYDAHTCYAQTTANNIKPVFPPKKGARVKRHGNCKGPAYARDEHIRDIRKYGKDKWREKNQYSRRNLAETTMFRFKTLLGSGLSSRNFDSQVAEALIKCKILNMMRTPSAI